MKIYIGKNKKEAKEISLKNLIMMSFARSNKFKKGTEFENDRLNDDSASWVGIRQYSYKGAIDVNIGFNPVNDNEIEDLKVWVSDYVLDEENMREII